MLLILKCVLSIPKTIFWNFRIFKFRTAIKMPIFVGYNVKIKGFYRTCIEIKNCKIRNFMIRFGIGGSDAIPRRKGLIRINGTKLIFYGKAHFSEGIIIYSNSSKIEFGKNVIFNKNNFISSDYDMKFGNEVLVGWNVNIRDSDGHKIKYKNQKSQKNNVIIGNHVWICSESDLLKGTFIDDNSVIAYKSCVCGLKTKKNVLIGGHPAKVLKENIEWEK